MLKLRQLLMIALITLIGWTANAQNWQLVWADEFTNGIGPDWVFETGTGSGGWGNNELQYYRQQNATVQNGELVITAKNESFGGMNYTSARMKTQGKKSWKYGKIEARMQLPAFQGSWPAFWMLGDNITSVGWPSCGEIDIMEQTNTSDHVLGTIHWNNNGYVYYGGNTAASVTGYHVYSIEWDANAIKWFVDGNLYHTANIQNGINGTSEFHEKFFIILNLAVGGNLPGNNVNNGALPASVKVDYVRVYQSTGGGTGAPVGQTIWLRGSNGQYASSENGAVPMNCNRNSVQGWEQFTVVSAGGSKIALRGSNGKYVSSMNGQSGMMCDRTTVQGWEAFDWVSNANGTISLRGNNGLYVSSENGQSPMICDRTTIQGWEQFTWGTGAGARQAPELDSELSEPVALTVFPNPVTNHEFKVRWDHQVSPEVQLSLMDVSGKTVYTAVAKDGLENVVLPSHLRKGVYILGITSEKGTETRNLIIK
jgi:beta-glucanase (GH16 family)